MGTVSRFNAARRYIMDTSSLLSQKENEPHDRKTFVTMWLNIERLIKEQRIVVCSENVDEIHDEEISKWLSGLQCNVVEIDDEVQRNVIKVVTTYPLLVDIHKNKSSADPFLIATALKYGLVVVSEEKKGSLKRIPDVCNGLGVDCVNINELCAREQWQF